MDQENQVIKDLRRLSHLMAISLVLDRKQRDQIAILNRAGFEPKEIADLLGTTSNTVSVALSALKKGGGVRLPVRKNATTEGGDQ